VLCETKWGDTFEFMGAVTECLLGAPAEIAGGTISKLRGGTFDEGIENVQKAMFEWEFKAGEFGDRHASELTNGAKKVGELTFSAVAGALAGRAFNK
jgi:hypothetical protein